MLENKYEFENQANRKKNHELVSLNRITKQITTTIPNRKSKLRKAIQEIKTNGI